MVSIDACRNSISPLIFFKWLKYKFDFMKEHPFYFYPDGLACFVGPQGTGKTLSAVLYVDHLMKQYPKAILVTNLSLRDYPFDDSRVFPFNNDDDFGKYNNGEYGVIFLVDEIQLYLNSLESKNINMDVVTQISQQRKQRKHIVCTSQVFGRMAKPLREQFSNVIVCNNYFGFFQFNKLVDHDSVEESTDKSSLSGKVKKRFFWFHSPNYYGMYDTYYVIEKNKFISEDEKKVKIYECELSTDN